MKKFPFRIAIPAIAILLCFILLISGANTLLTQFMENSNLVCNHQTFNSSEEAIQAMEANERENKDTSLDYCPPYEVLHTFDYEKIPSFYIVIAIALTANKAIPMLYVF